MATTTEIMICPRCDGTGHLPWMDELCTKCDGAGEVPLECECGRPATHPAASGLYPSCDGCAPGGCERCRVWGRESCREHRAMPADRNAAAAKARGHRAELKVTASTELPAFKYLSETLHPCHSQPAPSRTEDEPTRILPALRLVGREVA